MWIGVGLYNDYGRAQKLYVHLGYVPDGHGVTYAYQSIVPGESYPNLYDNGHFLVFGTWPCTEPFMISPLSRC